MKKRGISLMVSYVLIVIIAVAMGALIYSFLKLYLPSDRTECEPDISLTVEEVSCDPSLNQLVIKLSNSGLFNIDGAFIRFAESKRTVRPQLTENKNDNLFIPELAPGQLAPTRTYTLSAFYNETVEDYTLEVQPYIFSKGRKIPCENAIITQPVKCLNSTGGAGGGGAICGDGNTDAGEECDDGAGNSDITADACRTDCTSPVCGDGVKDTAEVCDNGGTCDDNSALCTTLDLSPCLDPSTATCNPGVNCNPTCTSII